MSTRADPFIGCEPTDLPPRSGIAATWWSPKPQIGNTHPGATFPLGMVSAVPYSGAYPTGYGRYDLATEGIPERIFEDQQASGVTHFQQSGTGAIRKYYNYFRVTPMLEPLEMLGDSWRLHEEEAAPGWYAATLDSGIRFEVTVGPRSAVHRFTFPRHHRAHLVVDCSHGGLQIPFGDTVPLRAALHVVDPHTARSEVVMEGAPLAAHLECTAPHWRTMLWYNRQPMHGGSRLDFSSIRQSTLRPFGILWAGPADAGETVELRIGFSLRGVEQAEQNLRADLPGDTGFEERRQLTVRSWSDVLDRVGVEASSVETQTVFDTAAYHSLVKPCLAPGESPFWPSEADGPFAFDICTMWDIYRTQLPLLTTLLPERAVDLATAMVTISEQEGNLPVGYRMALGADRFSRQGSALAHTFLADLCQLGLPGMDWEWALTHLHIDLRRGFGEDYLRSGETEPLSHTLDLATGYWCTARIAERLGDHVLAGELDALAGGWRAALEDDGALLRPSAYYEGTRWNYSFRLLPDMAARIAAAGGDGRFVGLLDRFFGYDAAPVRQPGVSPSRAELAAGLALGRFQGLNNEPDMESPWAYTYAGRPDRTAEVVHAIRGQQFGTGRGGLPGNDDSGGLSSWYVWAVLGLFPVAGQNLFLLHPPAHPHARLAVGNSSLTVTARNVRPCEPGRPAQYISSVRLNGRVLHRAWLHGHEVHGGGELVVTLSDSPTPWATAHRPPSVSTAQKENQP